jgi:hypothetical protein
MRIPGMARSMAIVSLAASCFGGGRPSDRPQEVIAAKFTSVNRHALAEIVSLYSPDVQVTASDFCRPRRGRAEVRRTYESLFARYPAIEVEVHDYVVQGENVVVRYTVKNQTPGASFAVPIMNWFVVRNGLIESDDGVFDTRGRPCLP